MKSDNLTIVILTHERHALIAKHEWQKMEQIIIENAVNIQKP